MEETGDNGEYVPWIDRMIKQETERYEKFLEKQAAGSNNCNNVKETDCNNGVEKQAAGSNNCNNVKESDCNNGGEGSSSTIDDEKKTDDPMDGVILTEDEIIKKLVEIQEEEMESKQREAELEREIKEIEAMKAALKTEASEMRESIQIITNMVQVMRNMTANWSDVN